MRVSYASTIPRRPRDDIETLLLLDTTNTSHLRWPHPSTAYLILAFVDFDTGV